ncbi:Kv channel-interacting protein 4 [Lamellibrachia satsuma]|nr:Kv channel-interacting protein 4 [Lamellibrachia satsuma]
MAVYLATQVLSSTRVDADNDLDDINLEAVRYKPPGLEQLCCSTKFTRNELRIMYRGFKQECPTGIVNEETFKEIYAQFFPHGDSSAYAHYVFSTFDQDHDGAVSFEDFVTGLSVLARGTFQEKLQWAFGLYDINGDGVITRDEMLDIIVAIYDLLGKMVEPSVDDATAKEHVHRIFDTMDSNKDGVITIEEFIEACRKDQHISKSMNIFDTVL